MKEADIQARASKIFHEALYGHDEVAGVEARLREALAAQLRELAEYVAGRGKDRTCNCMAQAADILNGWIGPTLHPWDRKKP